MPSRDPETGRRLGGAEQQRRKRAAGLQTMTAKARRRLKAIGEPPIDQPLEILNWSRRLLATTAWLVATDQIDVTQARAIKDSVFGLGATHNRSELERQLAEVRKLVAERSRPSGFVTEQPAGRIKRPPTARGQGWRGPPAEPTVDGEQPEPADNDGDE